jgi:hypothetical protein
MAVFASFILRESQRDVVYLSLPIAPSCMSPNAGGGRGVAGSQPMSTAEYSCTYGAQINFGDLTPYLTYGPIHVISLLLTNTGSPVRGCLII